MDIKKHCQKIFVFIINLSVIVFIVFGIKESNKNKFITQTVSSDTTSPVDSGILQVQSNIATDRENKLRSLNNSPKTVVQTNQTTTTKVQPAAVPATPTATTKTPTRKTKTS